jgi:outer membrane protein OmpA-like peptidoglycan-associated protein
MSQPDPGPARTVRVETTQWEDIVKRGRRPLGGPIWLAALGVPLLMGVIGAGVTKPGIESDLAARSTAALGAAGITRSTVSFDGRDAAITVPAGADAAKAVSIVRGLDGVRVADVAAAASTAGPSTGAPTASAAAPTATAAGTPAPPSPAKTPFSMSRSGADLVLAGTVPDEATHQAWLAAAKAAAGGGNVVDRITVAAGSPTLAGLSPAVLTALGASLPSGSSAAAAYDGTAVTLTGQVPSDAAKSAAGDAAAKALPKAVVVNNLAVAAPPANAACLTLGATVAAALQAGPLTFAESSAALNQAQAAEVTTLGKQIAGCLGQPGGPTALSVVGHSDQRGQVQPTDAISEARAAVVRDALVAAGVPADKIAVSAVGSSQSIAPNDTDAGRAQNRRVEITLK